MSYTISPDGLSIKCTDCGFESRNRNDVVNRFCGMCLVFHDDVGLTYTSELDIPLRRAVLICAKAGSDLFEARGDIEPTWFAMNAHGEELSAFTFRDCVHDQLAMMRAMFAIESVVRYMVIWFTRQRVQMTLRGARHRYAVRIGTLHTYGEDVREGKFTLHRDVMCDEIGLKLGPLTIDKDHDATYADLLPPHDEGVCKWRL